MNNEYETYYNACKAIGASISVKKSGDIVYKIKGDTVKESLISNIINMKQPEGFGEWLLSSTDDESNNITYITEADMQSKIMPYFAFGSNGNLRMVKRPEWDAHLCTVYDKGRYEITQEVFGHSISALYEVTQAQKRTRIVISKDTLLNKIRDMLSDKKLDEREELSKSLAYVPQSNDYLYYWMKQMDFADLDNAYDLMRHWLWLVKRNLAGKTTRFEIFVVWRSLVHGTGKSWSINYLTKPLDTNVLQYEVKSLTEERACALDSHNFAVMNFDELSRAEMTDIDSLKKWVTAQVLSYRPMGSNSSCTVSKIATGIGTSNRPLGGIIKDITGNRRFVELVINTKTRPEFGKEFGEDGEAWLSIWRNIDETNDYGYYDPERNPAQKLFVESCLGEADVVSTMLEDVFCWSETTDNNDPVTVGNIYKLYKNYCETAGYIPLSASNFKISFTIQLEKKYKVKHQRRSGMDWYTLPPINKCWESIVNPSKDTKSLIDVFTISTTTIEEEFFSKPESKLVLPSGISFLD